MCLGGMSNLQTCRTVRSPLLSLVCLLHENKSTLSLSSLTELTLLFYIYAYRNLIIRQSLINYYIVCNMRK
jgi:hypothetical protein